MNVKKSGFLAVFVMVFVALTACQDDLGSNALNGGENIRPGNANNVDPDAGTNGGLNDDISQCDPGEVLGCAADDALMVCNQDGDGVESQTCPAGEPNCYQGECGNRVCTPGVRSCQDTEHTHRCLEDGTGYHEVTQCPDGSVCEDGSCNTACEMGAKMVSSHFGCEYWTVYLDQYNEDDLPIGFPGGASASDTPHAVVISNPNEDAATIQFQSFEAGMTIDIADPVVPAGQSRAFTMPRMALEGTGVTRRGIFVRSTLPVTAHQFNPLNNENVYSNDASLLLPVSSLGTDYYVMNWASQIFPSMPIPGMEDIEPQKSYVTVIAVSQGVTSVVVDPTATIEAGGDINSFPPGVARSFELNFGDVLNLHANSGSPTGTNDLTGTFISGSQPIAVFAGHEQAVIGYDNQRGSCCADHIEQQLFSIDTWGQRYIAAFSPGRTNTKDHWRIMAGEDNVTITTNPPQPGANNVTLNAGGFVSFFSDENFEVEADGKILVGQFLVGQEQTNEYIGDPAFILAIPIERFRDDYHVLTPENYSADYITVIRPAGLEITLDGAVVSETGFVAVGSGEFEVASFPVNSGVHVVEGAEPFGILAYGLDNAVSYGYPGGLNMVGADANQSGD